ncbi:MAG: hypothetical protein Q7R64_04270 [bacterium]|nr:hypothetical protein [bacterium]
MWSIAIFGVSLFGLSALFAFKVLEMTRDTQTPLHHLRRASDPLIKNGWEKCVGTCRKYSVTASRLSAVWIKTTIHNAHLSFDRSLHALVLRLNRYLRGRRTQVRQGTTDVSVHLKSVLEKTEGDSSRPDSF